MRPEEPSGASKKQKHSVFKTLKKKINSLNTINYLKKHLNYIEKGRLKKLRILMKFLSKKI